MYCSSLIQVTLEPASVHGVCWSLMIHGISKQNLGIIGLEAHCTLDLECGASFSL